MTSQQQRLEELQQQAKALAEQIEQLEDQINNAKPTTGLLGRWAKHPEYGEVLIAEDRATDKGTIHVVYLRDDMKCGAMGNFVLLDDLTFPEQTTRPEDVPVGEAWLVNAQDSTNTRHGVAALKIEKDIWVSGDRFEWIDDEVELITPLIPAHPHDTPETVTTYEEYVELPEGSVVAHPRSNPWIRMTYKWAQHGEIAGSPEMAGTTRYGLRYGWGWGK